MKIKKGDTVIVLSGKNRGQIGEVIASYPKRGKVTVAGLNIVKRHQKAQRSSPFEAMQQGIIDKPAPLFISKVMLQCPHCRKGTRIHRVLQPDGRRARICMKCEKSID
ncbi:MAG TPA: 50S ribosomal protein L24 [Armatimonadota bacterium]|nr:50S ribosomal protein L24 [Armatimonadota bacterium]